MAVTLKGNNGTYEGTSEDNKPLDVPVNTEFNELDTGKTYYFDGETWNEEPPCESSGFTPTEQQLAAMNSGITAEKLQADETALAGKVDKETGKGLSANDFTTVEKTKLAGIAEGAEVNEIESIKVNNTTINPDANKVVNITVPTTAADVSALPDTTKYAVALSLTINSSTFVMTGQLKDQNGDNLGTAQTIDLPLESVVVGGSYNSQTKKVVLTLQNGNTIEFSVADLVSGLQTELSASNKLNPAYIDYDSTHRAVSDTEKSTWNGKQNAIDSSHKLSADLVDDTNATNKFATAEELEQIQTNENNILLIEQMNGAKNCIVLKPITQWNAPSGVTITQNDEGAYIFNGTVSSGYKYMAIGIFYYTSQTYHIHRSIISGGGYIYTNDNTLNSNAGNEYTYSTSGSTTVYLRIGKSSESVTFDNDMLSPMIITDAAYDAGFTDYQPYAMSNVELTAAIQAIQAQLANT